MSVDGSQTIQCPQCSVQLIIPGHAVGKLVRCPQCTYTFQMPDPDSMLDLEVADWLGDPDESDVFDPPGGGQTAKKRKKSEPVDLEEFVDEIRAEAEATDEDEQSLTLGDLVPIGDEDLPYMRGAERATSGKTPDAEADGTIGSGTGGEPVTSVRQLDPSDDESPVITRGSRGWFEKDRRNLSPEALEALKAVEAHEREVAQERQRGGKSAPTAKVAPPPEQDEDDDDLVAIIEEEAEPEAEDSASASVSETSAAAERPTESEQPSGAGTESVSPSMSATASGSASDESTAEADRADAVALAKQLGEHRQEQEASDESGAPTGSGQGAIDIEPALQKLRHGDLPVLRVLDVGVFGVRFAFDSKLLSHRGFRASLPLRCIHTLVDDPHQLIAKPLAWVDKATGHFTNTVELEAHYQVPLQNVSTTREALDQLRPIDEFTSPFNSPMPYYTSRKADSRPPIYCEAVASATGVQCEVIIPTLQYALQWLGDVNGVWGSDFEELEQRILGYEQKGWRALSEKVRQRISVWFELDGQERFIDYFADAEFSKADEGMAGVIVTDRRLVFNRNRIHGEIEWDQSAEIQAVAHEPFYQLHLVTGETRRRMVDLRQSDWESFRQIVESLTDSISVEETRGEAAVK